MKNYPCVEFKRPNAVQVEGFVEVSDHTATWLESRKAGVSFENCGPFVAVYLDVGWRMEDDPDGEPAEITIVARRDETLADAIARGVAIAIKQGDRPTFPRA